MTVDVKSRSDRACYGFGEVLLKPFCDRDVANRAPREGSSVFEQNLPKPIACGCLAQFKKNTQKS